VEGQTAFAVVLTITHYDAETGAVTVTQKTGDLLLKNFGILLVNYLRGGVAYDYLQVIDINGFSRTLYAFANNQFVALHYEDSRIAIGTGSGSPTPGDYKLASKVATMDIGSHTLLKSGTAMNLTVSAVFSITASYNITECGIEVKVESGGSQYWVLITRDSFPAIEVSPGDVLTVTYTFKMNQG
jgi:hypothetical protein